MDGLNIWTPAQRAGGTRWETVQHLYTVNSNSAPPNNTLLVGELGLELGDPVKIWAGVPINMDPTGRKLMFDSTWLDVSSFPEAPTDGTVYGRQGSTASWLGVLPLTGGTLTGQLQITSPTYAGLRLTATGGWPYVTWNSTLAGTAAGYFESQRYGLSRWAIEFGGTQAETGSNAGTDFTINRFSDAGTVLYPSPLTIVRGTGVTTIQTLFLGSDPSSALGAATKQYVDNNSPVGKYLPLTGGTLTGPLAIESQTTPTLTITGLSGIGAYTPTLTFNIQATGAAAAILQAQRSGYLRWAITLGDGFAPESGYNVGTDFIISRYDDGGNLLGNVITIARDAGAVQIDGTLTMLSDLYLAEDPTTDLEAATKHYVDVQLAAGKYLPLTGGNLTGPLSINSTGFTYPPQPGDQPLLTMVWTVGTGSTNVGEFIVSAGGGEPSLTGVATQGSMSSPVQPLYTQTLLRLAGRGHDGTTWTGDQAAITLRTNEQWSATGHGTFIQFAATARGTLPMQPLMVLNGSGALIIGEGNPDFDNGTDLLQVRGGGYFVGPVTLNADPVAAMQATTKQYVDSAITAIQGAYLPLTGGQLSGGLSFGQRLAASSTDLSQHISLFDGWGGFSVTANRLNIVHGGEAVFVAAGVDVAYFYNSGLWFNPSYTVTLGRDPTVALEAATMQYVQAQVASGAFLPLTGGTLTGNLHIAPPSGPAQLNLWGQPGYGATVNFFAARQRFEIGLSRDPENVNDEGSNFAVYSYHDDGSFIGTPLQILRADGYIYVLNTIQVGRLPTQAMEVATMGYVDSNITAVQGAYLPLVGGTLSGELFIDSSTASALQITGRAGSWPVLVFDSEAAGTSTGYIAAQRYGLNRWTWGMGDGTAESGGNFGTDFTIDRWADDGTTYLGHAIHITRSSGEFQFFGPVTLAQDPTTPLGAVTKQYVDTSAGNYLPIAGGIMQGGIVFADVWGQSPADVSHHLTLHSGFGIGVSATTRMNYVAGATGQHVFMAGDDIAWIQSGGLWLSSGNAVHLAQDPTAGDQAVTKQYADRMLPLAGGNMTGGITFQSDLAHLGAGPSDLSHHIALWNVGVPYGFSITSGRLNIVSGGQTWLTNSTSGVDIAYFDPGGLFLVGLTTATLGRNPTAPMEAAPKQYVDAVITNAGGPFLPISAGPSQPLTGMLYLPNVTPTVAQMATPKFYVDAQDASLQLQINQIEQNLFFVGQIDVPNDSTLFTDASGITPSPGPLPAPQTAYKGFYVIVTVSGSPPAGSNIPPLPVGATYTEHDWIICDGSEWVHLMLGLVYFTASQIAVLPPIEDTVLVQDTLQWLSDNKLNLAGGTMTGSLMLATNPTSAMMAATKQYVDSSEGNFLPLSGGTMQGGISFGTLVGASATDTSKHITLYPGMGFNAWSGRLDYNVPNSMAHVMLVGGIDVTQINGAGLYMIGNTDIYLARDPTTASQAATKNYVDARTQIGGDAPSGDGWWYGRHNGIWAAVPGFQSFGAGAYDLNAVNPANFQGLLQFTNQTGAPNWPSDNPDQVATVLHTFNSGPGWQGQLMMGGRQRGPMPALWYRSQDDEYVSGWSPWTRLIGSTGGTFAGSVMFGAPVSIWTGGTLGAVPLTIQANGNYTVPAPVWGGGLSFNLSGGGSELDFINMYNAAPTSFSWWQVDSATTMRQTMWLSANGDLSVSGNVYLPTDPTTPLMAATKQYVDNFLTRNNGPWLPLAAGSSYPLSGALFAQAIYMGSPLYVGTPTGGQIVLDAGLSTFRSITWASANHTIWDIQTEGAEPGDGTNAGADLYFVSFDDSGNPLYNTLVLSRATGYVTVRGDPVTQWGVATKNYVDNLRNSVVGGYLPLTGGTVTGPLLITGDVNLEVSATSWPRLTMTAPTRKWSVGAIGASGYFGIGDETVQAFRLQIDLNGGVSIPGPLTLGGDPTFAMQAATKQYVDAVQQLEGNYLPLSGGTMTGGISFGQAVANNPQDTSGHITLYSGGATNYGFAITSFTLNYNTFGAGTKHDFYSDTRLLLRVMDASGIYAYLPVYLPNDPTTALQAATKQYVDNRMASGVTSFNTRTGDVTLTSADVTNALTYTPVNRAGDTMSGELVVTVTPTPTSAQLAIGPPYGIGNGLEGKLRFAGTFGTGITGDLGARLIASLRAGYVAGQAWGGEYFDVWINNGGQNDIASDVNQVQVARFTRFGITMPASMAITLASDPTTALQATTKQYVDAVATWTANQFLRLSGGTLTGALVCQGPNPALVIDGPASTYRSISFTSNGSWRWNYSVTAGTESGGNVGSDFSISRCDDTGTPIDTPLVITRATGQVNFYDGVGPLSLNNRLAPTPTDLSQHLALWWPNYGFGITGGTLNVVAGGTIAFYPAAGSAVAWLNGTGLTMGGGYAITLAQDPTANLHAASKQYVDAVRNLVVGSYLPLAGGTMNNNANIIAQGTGGFFVGNSVTDGMISGSGDAASILGCNLEIHSWNGIGFSTSCAPYTPFVPAGMYGVAIDTRSGNLFVHGIITASDSRVSVSNYLQTLRVWRPNATDQTIEISANMYTPSLASATPVYGGTGYNVNDRLSDYLGNFYTVTAVSGGFVTSLQMDSCRAAIGAPPTNPVALNACAGFYGSGVTVNLNWATPSRLVVQHLAGQVALYGSAGITFNGGGGAVAINGGTAFTVASQIQPAAGISFGTLTGTGPTDLSKHLELWSNTFGIGISTGRQNYLVDGPSHHAFIAGTTDVAWIDAGGIGVKQGAVTLLSDPTSPLQAATKQYVDAKVSGISGGTVFVGTMNGSTGNCVFTTASGHANGPLPAPGTAANQYVICNVAGTPPSGYMGGVALAVQDWVMCDGTNWTHLAFNTGAILASNVQVSPTVAGAADVQTALTTTNNALANYLLLAGGTLTGQLHINNGTGISYDGSNFIRFIWTGSGTQLLIDGGANQGLIAMENWVSAYYLALGGGTLTGALILAADPTTNLGAATKQYVDNHVGTVTGSYLPLAGGALTGPLTITTNARALTISGTPNPRIDLYSTAGPTDSKYVDFYADANGNLGMQFVNDVFTAGVNFLQVNRSGYAIASMVLTAPTITLTGNAVVTGTLNTGDIYGNVNANVNALYLRSNLGIYYNTGGGHFIGFGWDGSWVNAYIDGGNVYQLASIPWVQGAFLYKSGDTCTGGLTVNGQLFTASGRLISQGASNPSVCVWNTAGYASVMFCDGSGNVCLGDSGGDGVPINARMTIDRSSNGTFGGQCSATQGNFNGSNVGNLGFLGTGMGYWMKFNWDGQNVPCYANGNYACTLVSSGWVTGWVQGQGYGPNWWGWNGSVTYLAGPASNASLWQMAATGACTAYVGAVQGNGAYVNISDRRIKRDIRPATVGLKEILAIDAISFCRLIRDEKGLPERVEIGFEAQQLQTIIPEAVVELEAAPGFDFPLLAVADTAIVAALVNSVKELTAMNTALAARVATLEARTLH